MEELDHKGWVLKNWCFLIVVLWKTLESSLDFKEIKPINPKGNQPWIFTGKTDAEAEAPILWPPKLKSWLTGKDSEAGKDRRQEEKGTKEDEMVGWYHWFNGHEFEQTLGDSEGQGSLACCIPWGCKELDTTARLNKHVIEYLVWQLIPKSFYVLEFLKCIHCVLSQNKFDRILNSKQFVFIPLKVTVYLLVSRCTDNKSETSVILFPF